jgi:hypothetical protein
MLQNRDGIQKKHHYLYDKMSPGAPETAAATFALDMPRTLHVSRAHHMKILVGIGFCQTVAIMKHKVCSTSEWQRCPHTFIVLGSIVKQHM